MSIFGIIKKIPYHSEPICNPNREFYFFDNQFSFLDKSIMRADDQAPIIRYYLPIKINQVVVLCVFHKCLKYHIGMKDSGINMR